MIKIIMTENFPQVVPIEPAVIASREGFMQNRGKFIAGLIASSLLSTACLLSAEVVVINKYEESCVATTDGDYAAVDGLMADAASRYPDPLSINLQKMPQVAGLEKEVAQNLGVTMIPLPLNYFMQLSHNESTESVINLANKQLNKFGVSLETPSESYSVSSTDNASSERNFTSQASPLSPKELNLDHTKVMIEDYVEQISTLPKELVEYSGIKKISLIKLSGTTSGMAESENDRIVLDPTKNNDGEIIGHELSHLVDKKQCHSQDRDTVYSALNPKGLYEDTPIQSLDQIIAEAQSTKIVGPNNFGSKTVALQQTLNKEIQQIAVIDQYARTNEMEDKAMIGQHMLDTNVNSLSYVLDSDVAPMLHAKYRLLFARLYSVLPAVATYLLKSH